jgi:hypothetical protein
MSITRGWTKGFGAIIFLIAAAFLLLMWRNHSWKRSDNLMQEGQKILTSKDERLVEIEALPSKSHQRAQSNERELSAHPSFELFNDSLSGNRELLSWAGLKADQFEKFDEIIDATWRQLSVDLEEKSVLIENETDDLGSVNQPKIKAGSQKTYIIPESNSRADERISILNKALVDNFGSGAAKRLMPYITRKEHLGGFGRYAVRVKFYTEIDEDQIPFDMAKIEILNPDTKEFTSAYNGHILQSRIYRVIGTAFGKPEGP